MPSINKTLQLLSEFKTLPNGWHFGEGQPILPTLLTQARAWVKLAEIINITRANAFPGVDGGVQIRFYNRDRIIEFTFETDGTVALAEDAGKTQVHYNENADIDELTDKLKEFAERVWTSSEQFTNDTLTTKQTNLPTQYYKNKVMLFRYSMRPVPNTPVEAFVPTCRVSTQDWSENQQSTLPLRKQKSKVSIAKNNSPVREAIYAITTSSIGIRGKSGNLLSNLSWTDSKFADQTEYLRP